MSVGYSFLDRPVYTLIKSHQFYILKKKNSSIIYKSNTITWYFDMGFWITQCPNIHHHIHPPWSKMFIVGWPGEANYFCMVTVEYIMFLFRKGKTKKTGKDGYALFPKNAPIAGH